MPDSTNQLIENIRDHRLQNFFLGDEFVYPAYNGLSLLNVPSGICRWMGAPPLSASPLAPGILERFTGDDKGRFRRVVLVLVDALGLYSLRRWLEADKSLVWHSLIEDGMLAALTSIVPSTTSSALTSLWTGRSTAEHSIAGYEMWMKEYGLVANMILHSPISFTGSPGSAGSLSMAGFQPDTFLPYPTLGMHLAVHGIKSFAFQHLGIARSGLSKMFFKEVDVHPFRTAAEMWINLRTLLESQPEERMFVWVYWGEIDSLSHRYGPEDERPLAEFSTFSTAFEKFFLSRLSASARENTLFILCADHGQVETQPNPHYDLRSHPNLSRRLHILPTGENRMMYLFNRPGQGEAVREYLERTWPRQFSLFDPRQAVEAGLFGPGVPHPLLLDRLGDLAATGRSRAYLWWSQKDNLLVGRHGGLSPEEMLVPFLAVRLDSTAL
jgi:hypothetical protein